jgi:glucose-1-phosphatase
VGSVLAALQVEDYACPDSIERNTPIGVKFVIEKWAPTTDEGEEMVSLRLVYQNTDQLRNVSLLNLDNPPASCPIRLKGLEQDGNGLYRLSDFVDRLDEAIAAYDELPERFGEMGALETLEAAA